MKEGNKELCFSLIVLTEKKKKDIWPKSREFFHLVGMFRTLSPEVSILVTQKTAPRRQDGKSGSMLFCNRRSRQSEHQRSVFSILCTGRCKPLGSLNLFLSYAPQLSGANHVSLFTFWSGRWLSLAFPQLLRSHLWVAVADSTGSQFGDPSFTFGGQKLLMVVTFHIYW